MTIHHQRRNRIWEYTFGACLICSMALASAVTAVGDQLLTVDDFNSTLVRIDADTGEATTVGPLSWELEGTIGDLTFHEGILYALVYQWGVRSDLITIDSDTGASCHVARVRLCEEDVPVAEGLASVNGQLIIAYNANFSGASPTLGVLGLDGAIDNSVEFGMFSADFDGITAGVGGSELMGVDTVPDLSRVDLYDVRRDPIQYDMVNTLLSGADFDYISYITFSGADLYAIGGGSFGTATLYRLQANTGLLDVIPLEEPAYYRGLVLAGSGVACSSCEAPDCNDNGVPDRRDVSAGTSFDCNTNGVPDECEVDCQGNGIPDECDIATGTSEDVDGDGVPDECATGCAPAKMYWTDTLAQTISRANLDGTNAQVLYDADDIQDSPLGIALDIAAGKVYWSTSDCTRTTGVMQRANMDGTGPAETLPVIVQWSTGPRFDFAENMMYWADFATGKIRRADMTSWAIENLVVLAPPESTLGPTGIVVDPATNTLYHGAYQLGVSSSNRIHRGVWNAGGMVSWDPLIELKESGPIGIQLDAPAGHLYWTMWPGPGLVCGSIERADVDGTNRVTLFDGLSGLTGLGLDVDRGMMYFGAGFPHGKSIQRAGMNGFGLEDVTPIGLQMVAEIALDLSNLTGPDCNGNGITDACEALALDCNNNGLPDDCDIAGGASQDVNGNGTPDECESLCPGDTDGDGSVGFNDLVSLLAAWGSCPDCPEDLDGDGSVGFNDLVMLLATWGPCS